MSGEVNPTSAGTYYGYVAQRGPIPPYDMELIAGSSYGSYVLTGGTNSSTGKHVQAAGDPVVGFVGYCRSGRTTGEQCNQRVDSVTAQVCTATGCKSPVIAYSNGGLSQPGDSGAPFYIHNGRGVVRPIGTAIGLGATKWRAQGRRAQVQEREISSRLSLPGGDAGGAMSWIGRFIYVDVAPSIERSLDRISFYGPDGDSATVGTWDWRTGRIRVDPAGASQMRWFVDRLRAGEFEGDIPVLLRATHDVDLTSVFTQQLLGMLDDAEIGEKASIVRVTDIHGRTGPAWAKDSELLVGVDEGLDDAVQDALLTTGRVRVEKFYDLAQAYDFDAIVVAKAGATQFIDSKRVAEGGPAIAFIVDDSGQEYHPAEPLHQTLLMRATPLSIASILKSVGSQEFLGRMATASQSPPEGPMGLMFELAGQPGDLVAEMGLPQRERIVSFKGAFADVVPEPEAADDRRVDLELRVGGSALPRDAPCEPGWHYTLAFSIGTQYVHSLFAVPPQPIAPQLGAEDEPLGGWALDVALFGHDFTVSGQSIQPLHLPHRGPSAELTFTIEAPDDTSQAKRFRVGVFRRNNLVQTFLVRWGPSGVHATDEARHLGSFDGIEHITERRLCLATNQDGATGDHSLLAPVAGQAVAIDLDGRLVVNLLDRMTTTLNGTIKKPLGGGLWFPDTEPHGQTRKFHDVSCELANAGWDLYFALFREAPDALRRVLVEIQSVADEPVQTVRLHPDLTVPWSLVYDWSLPEQVAGAPAPTMCTDLGCAHDALSEAYCIRGFWGVRLVVEEIDPKAPRSRKPLILNRPPDAGRIVLSTDTAGDAPTLVSGLTRSAGSDVQRFTEGKSKLLDALWREHPTTSAAVFVGHMEPGSPAKPGWPLRSHLVLDEGPPPQWLVVRDLVNHHIYRQGGQRMPDPGPLVLLLGCKTESTAMASIGSLPGDFLVAGAGAVISTLCPIHVGFATDFSTQVIGTMLKTATPIGTALQQWRRRIVAAGNPLAFALVMTGETDLAFSEAAA